MKVLFILEHYAPYIGGAETLFIGLCEALAAEGFEVQVLTTRFQSDLAKRETLNGVRIHRVDCRNRYLFSVFSLPRAIRLASWADVIHTTTYNAAIPAWVAAKIYRRPIFITFHEVWDKLWFDLPFLSKPAACLFYLYERLVVTLPFDRYIAVSDFTARALVQAGVKNSKIKRIYNGLDYTQFTQSHRNPGQFTYTYFGRLGVSKGLDLIIPAAAQFRATHPDSSLRLIIPKRPAGMYRAVLKLIREYGLADYVELLHELPDADLRRAVSTSSCVLITSYSEGFCFVAAESAAMGVPIISSGRGALAETVSGTVWTMTDMTADSLVACLTSAAAGVNQQWIAPRRFPLAESIALYHDFYTNLRK